MKKKLLLLSLLVPAAQLLHAQAVTAVTGLRLYEHHSPAIAGTQGANGTQSGYDFVTRNYYHSYNAATMGPYTGGEEANIDLVEHNGIYGNGGNGGKFGFTSGMSTIWINEIKGNGTTKWMKAPAGFDYAALNNVSQIAASYSATTATQSIATVEDNTVYLARIRNSALYVAMRVGTVKNKTNNDNNIYFDFDYKYGTLSTGLAEGSAAAGLTEIFPNPAQDKISIRNKGQQAMTAKVMTASGQLVQSLTVNAAATTSLDLTGQAKGLYLVLCTGADGQVQTYKFLKQ